MRIVSTCYLAATAAAMCLALPAHAQDARTVVLRFRKAGDTVAVRGAQITIDHTIEAGLTDSAGMIKVPDLEDGGHIVEALAKGYEAFFDKFVSGPNVAMPIVLELLKVEATAKAKGLPTPLVATGFDQRRARGQGKFFTAAQLKAANGRPLSNLLKIDASATIAAGPRGESYLASAAAPTAGAACYATVVLDGLRIYPFENAPPPDLDKIFTDDLVGVEFYARSAAAPAEVRDASACGALVLWRR